MDIKLLDIASRILERDGQRSSIHLDGAVDSTSSLTLCENIQKYSLTGTRRAHQSSEYACLDIAMDVVKEDPVATRGADGVSQVLLHKDALILEKVGLGSLAARVGARVSPGLLRWLRLFVMGLQKILGPVMELAGDKKLAAALAYLLPPEGKEDSETGIEDPPGDVNAKIAPDVTVGEGYTVEILIASKHRGAGGRDDDSGIRLAAATYCVLSSVRDEVGSVAGDLCVVKLITEEDLKAICYRVDPENSNQLQVYLRFNNYIAYIDKESNNRETRDFSGSVECGKGGTDKAEVGGYRQSSNKDSSQIYKESTCCSLKTSYPVENNIKLSDLKYQDGDISYDLGDTDSRRMVQSKRAVLSQNRPAGKGVSNFSYSQKRVIQKEEKEGAALKEETEGVIRGVVEERATKQSLYEGGALLYKECSLITPYKLVLPDGRSVHLGCKAGCSYSFIWHALVLLAGGHLLKDGRILDRLVAVGVVLALLEYQGLDLRLVVGVMDLLCGPQEAVLVSRGNNMLIEYYYFHKEVAAVRPGVASEAEALQKGDSFLLGAIVDLLALVKDEHLIELLIDAVTSLVEGNNSRQAEDVSQDANSLNLFQGCAGIKTSC